MDNTIKGAVVRMAIQQQFGDDWSDVVIDYNKRYGPTRIQLQTHLDQLRTAKPDQVFRLVATVVLPDLFCWELDDLAIEDRRRYGRQR